MILEVSLVRQDTMWSLWQVSAAKIIIQTLKVFEQVHPICNIKLLGKQLMIYY